MEAKKSSNLKKFFATVVSAFISRWKPLGLNVAIRILQKCSTTSHLLNVKFLVGMTNKQTLANVYFEIETAYSFFNFFFIAPEMCKPSKMDYTIFLMEFPPPFFFPFFDELRLYCGIKESRKGQAGGKGKANGWKILIDAYLMIFSQMILSSGLTNVSQNSRMPSIHIFLTPRVSLLRGYYRKVGIFE